MSERLAHILKSLPPEGIAIHGTNLANAKDIQNHGFSRTNKVGKKCYAHYYFVQPPATEAKPDVPELMDNIEYDAQTAIYTYAIKAKNKAVYHKPDNPEESNIPALVVFLPLRPARNLPDEHPSYSRQDSEDNNIPPENILGYISLDNLKRNKNETIKYALKGVYKLMRRKGIIDFGAPQQPQVK